MKKSKKQMLNNVMQRIPAEVKQLVTVAIESKPAIVGDLDKIVRTHSCRSDRAIELMEHVVALVASDFPEANRQYLRRMAFSAKTIDDGKKEVRYTRIRKLEVHEKGLSFTMTDGWSMYTDFAPDGYIPQVGSEIWQYAIQFSLVLGLVIDGHVFRYRTAEQEYVEREIEKERRREEERKKFPEHDARIAKLPEIFQQRIRKFQWAPHFREDLESYELFVCEQAVLFAERLKTVKKLKIWRGLKCENQEKFIPELKAADHSGNTFGMACVLAWAYLEDPEKVPQIYGALAPLTGSDAYLPLEERMNKSA